MKELLLDNEMRLNIPSEFFKLIGVDRGEMFVISTDGYNNCYISKYIINGWIHKQKTLTNRGNFRIGKLDRKFFGLVGDKFTIRHNKEKNYLKISKVYQQDDN
jgi:hypothetical protein